ncbi:MAG: molybdopterin molybdotransferase MoeA [Haloarculaceae archaeon]
MTDRHDAGFHDVIDLATARERVREAVATTPSERIDSREADGRVLAEPVTARRPVPHYERAAMDGFAVRADDTRGAGDHAPVWLSLAEPPLGPGEAAQVHTGSELPEGADAVVMVERTSVEGEEVAVRERVAPGENVAPAGEDVSEGRTLFPAGHRLRPADIALAESAGVRRVAVRVRPSVAVLPTGDEVVDRDPEPGEVVETNGGMVGNLTERWGGEATVGGIVEDDPAVLGAAIADVTDAGGTTADDAAADVVVTTGGSSVGERDRLPEVLADRGDVLFHGVAIRPGHPVAAAVVEGTLLLALPGYPVSTYACAVQLLRPALAWATGTDPDPFPTTAATLTERTASDPGTRQFVRVGIEDGEARPLHTSGAGVLSSVTDADGWLVLSEDTETVAPGTTVTVELWPE